MPLFYLDSSAITKRYCTESGTEFMDALYEFESGRSESMYTARHAIAEVISAFYMKMRMGLLDAKEASTLVNTFLDESIDYLEFIETTKDLYSRAIVSLSKHPLRAADAVHLAAALDVYSFHGPDLHFVCNDNRLCDAAHSEGLQVLKPGEEEAMKYLNGLILPENGEEKKSPGVGD